MASYTKEQIKHVCMYCKRVTQEATDAPPPGEDTPVSHGVCVDCLQKLVPEDE